MSMLKRMKYSLLIVLLVIGSIGNAWADRPHRPQRHHSSSHFGIYFGPAWGPAYYPGPFSPYYYRSSPPIVIERAPPPIYVERAEPAPAPNAYWYYCRASKAYYPYVGECPSGWQRVLPQPPDQP